MGGIGRGLLVQFYDMEGTCKIDGMDHVAIWKFGEGATSGPDWCRSESVAADMLVRGL